MGDNRRGYAPGKPHSNFGRSAGGLKLSDYTTPAVHAPPPLPIETPAPSDTKYVSTTPSPPAYFNKIRFVLLVVGFLFFSMFVAFILAISVNSPKQHRIGQQPHIIRSGDTNVTEMEAYWEFTVVGGLQSWQELPASGPIPGIVAPKGSVQKFEVSCTTINGITLSKGFGFDALSFDARLRNLPIDGDIKLMFYANNAELLQAKCILFVKINPQF